MMKRIFFLLIFLNAACNIFAQVSYQTGSSTFNIPMFQWQDDKSRLSSSVSLNYNSGSGLQVSDIASNVGQGWNLQIGGYISRMQIGEPDDQVPRDGVIEDITKYPPGYLYDPKSAEDGCPSDLLKYPIFKDKNHIYKNHNSTTADKELDHFAFEINGRTGIFVLAKNNGDKGIVLGDSKLKVWYDRDEHMPGIRTSIKAFYIQDENGVIYKFADLSLSEVLKTSYSNATGTVSLVQPKFKSLQIYHESSFDIGLPDRNIVTGWFLTEIEDALTHRKITFKYEDKQLKTEAGTSVSYMAEKGYAIISHNISWVHQPEITSITFPDGHEVDVNYGEARIDVKGANVIESVDIKYNDRYLSKYDLKTDYFILNREGKPETDFQKRMARLALRSVHKIGIDLKSDDNPYKFEYYTGSTANADDIVPPPFSFNKDIWGYYNGDYTKGYNNEAILVTAEIWGLNFEMVKGLCFLRAGNIDLAGQNTKPGYAKNGLLKKITYPTGGTLKFNYAQNETVLNGQNTLAGGVHVSETVVSDEGNNYNCDVTNMETSYNYIADGQSSLWGVEPVLNYSAYKSYYAPEKKKYKWSFHCFPFGCCKYQYLYPGILSRDQSIDITGHERFLESFSAVMDAVGAVSTIIDVINYITVAGTPATAIIIDAIVGIYTLIASCLKNYSKLETSTSYTNFNINNNPLPAQFGRVEITESGGDNGKTAMEFTGPADYPIWESSNPALSMKQRVANWAYGLPKKTTVYDAIGNKVKETENTYDYQFASSTTAETYDDGVPATLAVNVPSCKCDVKYSTSQRSDQWSVPNTSLTSYNTVLNPGSIFSADIYHIKNGRTELRKTTERTYKQGTTEFLSTETEYQYNSHNYLPKSVTTTQSNGDKLVKNITYTGDAYNYGAYQGVLHQFAANNIINIPVETRTTVIKPASNTTYDLSETVTTFTPTATGDIKPAAILEHRYSEPSLVSGSGSYYAGPGAPSTNAIPYKTVQSFDYDGNANLTTQVDEGFRRVYNFYDYNDKFITASVINSGGGEFKEPTFYTSFETSKTGNWNITGTPAYAEDNAVTGKRSFVLNSNNGINTQPNGTFNVCKISFWSTAPVTVTNATLEKSAPVKNGFTYYEYKTAYNGNISITGNATIDELRLYPVSARMRSVTYDPILGKTSECDENNHVTYYEYDDKGRMSLIKDHDKNIVKMYEYNEAIKKVNPNCAGQAITYSNPEVSEEFVRQCDKEGSIGSSVTYTIPAGTYTSNVSQDMVDALVQNDLATNGQAYANSHGICNTVYKNVHRSEPFTKEGCDEGYTGTTVNYEVAAGVYSSIISQADADAQATVEIDANGQAFANLPGNANCVITTEPDWEGTDNQHCGTGSIPSDHMAMEVIDINPNSPTYNQTQWVDGGPSAACGANVPTEMDITFTNAGNMQATAVFTNLGTGQVYSLALAPNTTTAAVAGFVLTGNYTIDVTVPFGSTAHTIQVYSTTQTAPFHQSPVTVSTPGTAIIKITN